MAHACNMKVMGYEIAFQVTMPFPRANAWNASQDFLYPLRFKHKIVSLPPPPCFVCCNYFCEIKVPVDEVHLFLKVCKQVSVYSKICSEQN